MGRGGTNSLWSSGITCKATCSAVKASAYKQLNLEEVNLILILGRDAQSANTTIKLNYNNQCYRDKPHGQLVLVSLTHYCASTPSLSTSWSRTTLQGAQGPGKTHLETSFPLRCFQRLSLPHLATRLCHWRDNRCTRGASTPVLSY